jgi:hypothetical protein
MKHKATLRIPCKEQYSYIEVSVDGTPDEIIDTYIEITQKYQEKSKVVTEIEDDELQAL